MARQYPLQIFYYNGDTEDMRRYEPEPGGYRPIHLGDVFPRANDSHQSDGGIDDAEPRYRVLRKLGYGAFATVWLGEDMKENGRAVAMKFTVSNFEGRSQSRESEILQYLSTSTQYIDHPGRPYVLGLLDYFQLRGPNGIHDVLVTEVLFSSRLMRDLKILDAKSAAYDVARGLAYLHSQGIVHGDIHADNISFRIPHLSSHSHPSASIRASAWMEELEYPETCVVVSRQFDKTRDLGGQLPKYLVENADLYTFAKKSIEEKSSEKKEVDRISAVIMDFGSSFRASHPTPERCTPLCMRPPEAIFENRGLHIDPSDIDWYMAGDVWALGCTIYELLTGHPFFYHVGNYDALLGKMIKCTGPLPEEWYAMTDPKPYEDAAAQVKIADEYWATLFPNDKELVLLLRSMMRFGPRERMTAEEFPDAAWFEEIRTGDVERKMRTAEAA